AAAATSASSTSSTLPPPCSCPSPSCSSWSKALPDAPLCGQQLPSTVSLPTVPTNRPRTPAASPLETNWRWFPRPSEAPSFCLLRTPARTLAAACVHPGPDNFRKPVKPGYPKWPLNPCQDPCAENSCEGRPKPNRPGPTSSCRDSCALCERG